MMSTNRVGRKSGDSARKTLFLPQVLKYKKNAPKIWSQAFKPPFGGPFHSSCIVADESEDRTPGPLSNTLCFCSIARPKNVYVREWVKLKSPAETDKLCCHILGARCRFTAPAWVYGLAIPRKLPQKMTGCHAIAYRQIHRALLRKDRDGSPALSELIPVLVRHHRGLDALGVNKTAQYALQHCLD